SLPAVLRRGPPDLPSIVALPATGVGTFTPNNPRRPDAAATGRWRVAEWPPGLPWRGGANRLYHARATGRVARGPFGVGARRRAACGAGRVQRRPGAWDRGSVPGPRRLPPGGRHAHPLSPPRRGPPGRADPRQPGLRP